MIDFAGAGWNAEELAGISSIVIAPNVTPDLIALSIRWYDAGGEMVREDSLIQLLKPLLSTGEASL